MTENSVGRGEARLNPGVLPTRFVSAEQTAALTDLTLEELDLVAGGLKVHSPARICFVKD